MGYFIIIINRNTLSQELSSLLSWTFYTLSFAPLFAILELHMKKYNHIYRPFVFIYFVFVVVVGIWWAVVGQPERWLLNLFMPLSSLAFGVALVLSVLEWRQKNKFFRQLAIWLGFGVLIALLCYLI